jgi:hypothetical protein
MATGLFKNAKVSGAATDGTELYTVPSGKYATVHSIYVTNTYNLEDLYVNIEIVNGSDSYYLAYLYPVQANMGAIFERPINLEDSEVLRVTASRADSIDVVANVLEFTP